MLATNFCLHIHWFHLACWFQRTFQGYLSLNSKMTQSLSHMVPLRQAKMASGMDCKLTTLKKKKPVHTEVQHGLFWHLLSYCQTFQLQDHSCHCHLQQLGCWYFWVKRCVPQWQVGQQQRNLHETAPGYISEGECYIPKEHLTQFG